MGFYPTHTAIFNAYTRSKLAYIRGPQGLMYTRAKMRVYAITYSYTRGFKNPLYMLAWKVPSFGKVAMYDANEKYLLKQM